MGGSRQQGFSLIELVAVIVIIGALAVFAAPRLNIQGLNDYSVHAELLSAARSAQKTAVASRCPVTFSLNASDDAYSVAYVKTAEPCDSSNELLARSGVESAIASDKSVRFDGFGVPVDASGHRLTTITTINLAGGREINIEPRTGYVHD